MLTQDVCKNSDIGYGGFNLVRNIADQFLDGLLGFLALPLS